MGRLTITFRKVCTNIFHPFYGIPGRKIRYSVILDALRPNAETYYLVRENDKKEYYENNKKRGIDEKDLWKIKEPEMK